jgi:hypothetical protein
MQLRLTKRLIILHDVSLPVSVAAPADGRQALNVIETFQAVDCFTKPCSFARNFMFWWFAFGGLLLNINRAESLLC